MVRIVLRVIGLFCFGFAALNALEHWEATTKLYPVDEIVILQPEEVASVSFIPSEGMSADPEYIVELQFQNAQPLLLDCNTIQKLGIRWRILENIQPQEWSIPSETPSQIHTCDGSQAGSTIKFVTPQLTPGLPHYLQLTSELNRSENAGFSIDEIRIRVIVTRNASLDVHYGLIDQGMMFIVAFGFGAICAVCFLVDLTLGWISFVKRSRSQPNVSTQQIDESP